MRFVAAVVFYAILLITADNTISAEEKVFESSDFKERRDKLAPQIRDGLAHVKIKNLSPIIDDMWWKNPPKKSL
jgi:hypothetical protein